MDHVTEATLVASTRTEFDGYRQHHQNGQSRSELAAKTFLTRYRVKNTRATYAIALKQWFGWCREHGLDPLDATRPHVEMFARELEATGRCTATVAGKINVLGVFYKFAVIDEYIVKDPTLHVTRPQVERVSKSSVFTARELTDMLEAAEKGSTQDYALISVLAYHGLRISEVTGIDVEDVIDSRGQLAVTITRKGGKQQLITLASEVAWIVKRLVAERGDTGPIFVTKTGRRLDAKSAGLVVKRVAKAAGITKRAHPHAFRKTMATLSRNAGIPDREIIAAAGWSTPAMLQYYDGGKDTLQLNAARQYAVFLDRVA